MTHPTPDTLTVGLVQCLPALGDIQANIAAMGERLDAHPECDVMIWPELYLTGYTTTDAARLAVPRESDMVARLCALAASHNTALVLGLAEQTEAGPANSALAIDRDGRIAGCYRKAQLFGDEAGAFVAGEHLYLARLCGVPVGLMICFDIEFPEVARALAEAGSAIYIAISANMTPFGPDHRLCVQARALENRRPLVYVNQGGHGERFAFVGESAVADDAGRIVAACADSAPEVVVARVSLGAETTVRPDYLALRRGPLSVIGTSTSPK